MLFIVENCCILEGEASNNIDDMTKLELHLHLSKIWVKNIQRLDDKVNVSNIHYLFDNIFCWKHWVALFMSVLCDGLKWTERSPQELSQTARQTDNLPDGENVINLELLSPLTPVSVRSGLGRSLTTTTSSYTVCKWSCKLGGDCWIVKSDLSRRLLLSWCWYLVLIYFIYRCTATGIPSPWSESAQTGEDIRKRKKAIFCWAFWYFYN